MSRTTSLEQREILKAFTKDLVSANGGSERITRREITRVQKSNLSDYGNRNRREIHAPIDIVLDLELSAGDPLVTRELARMQGFALLPLNFDSNVDPAVAGHLARLGKEVADVFAYAATALSDNGKIDPDEAPRLGKELDEAIDALVQIKGLTDQISKQAPPTSRANK